MGCQIEMKCRHCRRSQTAPIDKELSDSNNTIFKGVCIYCGKDLNVVKSKEKFQHVLDVNIW